MRVQELVEGKKFFSSKLIMEDFFIAHGLSIRVEDPDVLIIDEYGSPDTQRGNLLPYFDVF